MPDTRRPEEIRQDIAEVRAQMDRTIDELERRLSPGEMLDRTWSRVKNEGPAVLGDLIRSHPLPLAAVSAGLAWLAFDLLAKKGDESQRSSTWQASDHLVDADESPFGAAGARHDAAAWESWHDEDTWHQESPSANRLTVMTTSLRDAVARRPLIAGAIALSFGLAAGLAAPPSRWEDRLRQVPGDSTLA